MTVEHTCDTSVLVPALISWHPEHEQCRHVVAGVDRLPAHVLLETYSVLTRLPAPHRIDAADAAEAIAGLEFAAVTLPGRVHRDLVVSLAGQRIRGGAVYDALVAATARHHGLHLVSRDRRARSTYDAVGVGYTLG